MPSPYRVVLVDDDVDVRTLARRYLERSGRFTVVAEATNGEEAVEAARRQQPDLTLLDLLMPDTDGLEALPRIRAAAPEGTVVVLSGLQRPNLEGDVLAAGAGGLLAKRAPWSRLASDLLALLEDTGPVDRPGPVREAAFDLPAELTSGGVAREFLREKLTEWRAAALLEDAELLTTELVNNAVLHAASSVVIRVRLDTQALRVEVVDTGAGALHRQQPTVTDTGGRGLFLVEALSQEWGTSAGEHGKAVWFELAATEPETAVANGQ